MDKATVSVGVVAGPSVNKATLSVGVDAGPSVDKATIFVGVDAGPGVGETTASEAVVGDFLTLALGSKGYLPTRWQYSVYL